jgi:hypothetical protein
MPPAIRAVGLHIPLSNHRTSTDLCDNRDNDLIEMLTPLDRKHGYEPGWYSDKPHHSEDYAQVTGDANLSSPILHPLRGAELRKRIPVDLGEAMGNQRGLPSRTDDLKTSYSGWQERDGDSDIVSDIYSGKNTPSDPGDCSSEASSDVRRLVNNHSMAPSAAPANLRIIKDNAAHVAKARGKRQPHFASSADQGNDRYTSPSMKTNDLANHRSTSSGVEFSCTTKVGSWLASHNERTLIDHINPDIAALELTQRKLLNTQARLSYSPLSLTWDTGPDRTFQDRPNMSSYKKRATGHGYGYVSSEEVGVIRDSGISQVPKNADADKACWSCKSWGACAACVVARTTQMPEHSSHNQEHFGCRQVACEFGNEDIDLSPASAYGRKPQKFRATVEDLPERSSDSGHVSWGGANECASACKDSRPARSQATIPWYGGDDSVVGGTTPRTDLITITPCPQVSHALQQAFAVLGLQLFQSVDYETLHKCLARCILDEAHESGKAGKIAEAFATSVRHQDRHNCWRLQPAWPTELDRKLLEWKTAHNSAPWSSAAMALGMPQKECKKRWKTIKPQDWNSERFKKHQAARKEQKMKAAITQVAPARVFPPEVSVWSGVERAEDHGAWDVARRSEIGGWSAADDEADNGGWLPKSKGFHQVDQCTEWGFSGRNDCLSELHTIPAAYDGGWNSVIPDDVAGNAGAVGDVHATKHVHVSPPHTAYTVTYWATIESDKLSVHIPIHSDNINGLEKTIIEGDPGMKKVWKWVKNMGLEDRIGLQDAFDLARDMSTLRRGERNAKEDKQPHKPISPAWSPRALDPDPIYSRAWSPPVHSWPYSNDKE